MPIERRVIAEPPTTRDIRVVRTQKSGGNGFLYFAVGALIVAVGALGYFYYETNQATTQRQASADQKVGQIGQAADKLGDTVRDAARAVDPRPQTLSAAPPPVQPNQPQPQAPAEAPAPQ